MRAFIFKSGRRVSPVQVFAEITFGQGEGKAAQEAGAVTLNYGLFVNTLINFLIVALVIFMLVRQINKLKKAAPAAPALHPKMCCCCAKSATA